MTSSLAEVAFGTMYFRIQPTRSLYCRFPRDRELVSLIAGIYFIQTSAIYFAGDLAAVRFIGVSVIVNSCLADTSLLRALTRRPRVSAIKGVDC